MNFLDNNPSLKRLVVMVVGAATVALNRRLGLDLDALSIASITGMVVAYIGQSALKEVAIAKVDAAAAVVTPSDAAKELAK